MPRSLLFALCLAASLFGQQTRKSVTQQEVDRITREAILIDTHNDITSKTVAGYDIAKPNRGGQTDLPRMKGFLGAEFFAVYVGANYAKDNQSANRALQMIDTVRTDIIAAHPITGPTRRAMWTIPKWPITTA